MPGDDEDDKVVEKRTPASVAGSQSGGLRRRMITDQHFCKPQVCLCPTLRTACIRNVSVAPLFLNSFYHLGTCIIHFRKAVRGVLFFVFCRRIFYFCCIRFPAFFETMQDYIQVMVHGLQRLVCCSVFCSSSDQQSALACLH